jgi:hypothetical protein
MAGPQRVQMARQHARPMAKIAQFRLQRLNLGAPPAPSGSFRCCFRLALQPRVSRTPALDFPQCALFQRLKTRLGKFCTRPLPFEVSGKIGARVRVHGIAVTPSRSRRAISLSSEPRVTSAPDCACSSS